MQRIQTQVGSDQVASARLLPVAPFGEARPAIDGADEVEAEVEEAVIEVEGAAVEV